MKIQNGAFLIATLVLPLALTSCAKVAMSEGEQKSQSCTDTAFGSNCGGGGGSLGEAHAFLYQLTPIQDPHGWPADQGMYAGQNLAGSFSLLNSESVLSGIELHTPSINVPKTLWSDGFPGYPNLTEWFGLCYDGTWTAPANGSYTIVTDADDGVAVWVDGQFLGEVNDGNFTMSTANYEGGGYNPDPVAFPAITLSAGPHAVEIMYYQGWPLTLRAQVWMLSTPTIPVGGPTDSDLMTMTAPAQLSCPH